MFAAIQSKEERAAGNVVLLPVDEFNFNKEGRRLISKQHALDGTTYSIDWGYPVGRIKIVMADIVLSETDYQLLIGMKEDDNYDFLFTYIASTWHVIIEYVRGIQVNKNKRRCNITLPIVEKYSDMETS